MNIAVIPARAGSKGIVGKNYRLINGKPLVAWSIEAAMACRQIDLIAVSSNCPEVQEVTRSYDCPFLRFVHRPEEIAGDHSTTEEALIHTIYHVLNTVGMVPDWVTLLQPTSPVRCNNLLNMCCNSVLHEGGVWDSLLTASQHTPFFYQLGQASEAIPLNHRPCVRPMRQQLAFKDFLYHDNGNVYMTKTEVLLDRHCRLGESPYLQITSPYQSYQIDSPEDFVILESMSKSFGPFI